MDIGRLYDEHVATHYDADPFGLLSGGRDAAARQLAVHATAAVADIVDLCLGTGESLRAVRPRFPAARLHGFDVSEKMIQGARSKLDVHAVHADARDACGHLGEQSADVVLIHFLTTYVQARAVLEVSARLLRPGGLCSIVNGTMEAFPKLHGIALDMIPAELLQRLQPSPASAAFLEAEARQAGLSVVVAETVERPVSFPTFQAFFDFGHHSGFFTHLFDALGPGPLQALASLEGVFPLDDVHRAAVVLARKP